METYILLVSQPPQASYSVSPPYLSYHVWSGPVAPSVPASSAFSKLQLEDPSEGPVWLRPSLVRTFLVLLYEQMKSSSLE